MRSTVPLAGDRNRDAGVDGQHLPGHPAGLIAGKINRRIAFVLDEAGRCSTLTPLSVNPLGDQRQLPATADSPRDARHRRRAPKPCRLRRRSRQPFRQPEPRSDRRTRPLCPHVRKNRRGLAVANVGPREPAPAATATFPASRPLMYSRPSRLPVCQIIRDLHPAPAGVGTSSVLDRLWTFNPGLAGSNPAGP